MIKKLYTLFIYLLLSNFCFAQQISDESINLKNEIDAFEENKGQIKDHNGEFADEVKFTLPLGDNSIFLLENGIAYQFKKIHYPEDFVQPSKFLKTRERIKFEETIKSIKFETFRIDFELLGSNDNVEIITEGKSHDYNNFYNHDAFNVYSYSSVTYKNIYDGIDWVLTTTDGGVKYDFIVHPGADPSDIKLKYKYQNDIELTDKQALKFGGLLGDIVDEKPISFQGDTEIPTEYQLDGNIVSYQIGSYDKTKTLIIDPLSRLWGTYYGGTGTDVGNDVNVDNLGNSYLVGSTLSSSGIASGGHDVSFGGNYDAYLAKFNPAGVRQWATYYGNSGSSYGNSTVADGSNNVYIVGSTSSTSGFYSGVPVPNGYGGSGIDAYIAKFNSAGVRQWGTRFGGSLSDWGNGVDVDASNNVYMAGNTRSTNNIYSSPGHQSTANGGVDAFLVKFNSAGTKQFGTYYGIDIDDGGGGEWTEGWDCAVSSSFVFLVGFVEYNLDGEEAAYIARYGLNGTAGRSYNIFHGYVGNANIGTGTWDGTGNETFAYSCAVDASGNPYLGGVAESATSNGTFSNVSAPFAGQSSAGSGVDGIMVKFNSALTPQWKSFYGGNGQDWAYSVYHQGGDIYLGGRTASTNNIASGGYQNSKSTGVDAFLAKFNTSGVRDWGTYYGGNGTDIGNGCAVDGSGSQFLCGVTASTNNIASGGHQNTKSTGNDGFLVKFADCIAVNNTTSTASICEDQTKTLTASGTGGTWTIVSGGGTISGSVYTPANISVATTVIIRYTDACGNQTDRSFIVNPLPSATISRNNAWICSGGNSTFTASLGSGSTFSRFEYRWDNTGTWNAWGTTNPYTWNPGNPTVNGRYLYVRVRTTSAGGCIAYSAATWVRLYFDPSTPVVTRSPTATTVCIGQAIDIPVSSHGSNGIASNGAACATQYRYAQGGGGYTGWITSTNPPSITATSAGTFYYQYRRYCTGSGCSDPVATQSWTVVADPTISSSGGGTICSGGNRTLSSSTSGGTGCTNQWQISTNNSTWSNIGGATGSTYNTGTLTATRYYRVVRNCNGSGCSDPISNVQTVSVVADPSISTSGGGTICSGGNRTLSSSTLGGTGTCTYQWQISTNNSTWSNIGGATGSTYNTGTLTATRYYRVVRNCDGNGCSDPISNVQTVTVVADPLISISADATICSGGNRTLSSSTSGGTGTCTYQWQVSTNGSTWSSIGGATGSTYNTGSLTATRYYRLLRNCNGSGCNDPASNTVRITVVADPIISASGGGTICSGGNRTLSSSTSGGTGTCTYQWQISANNSTWSNIGGATSSTYNTGALTATRYYRVVRNCNGNDCSDPTSNVQTVTVNANTSSAITDTICSSEMYTLPSGTVVMGAGVYPDVIQNTAGCDSNITVTLVTPPSARYYGLYAASPTEYFQVNPLTGDLINDYNVPSNALAWVNGAFIIHEQAAKLYWIAVDYNLYSLDLTSGAIVSIGSAMNTISSFWGLRYYDGFLYTVTTSADNDKVLVRINPSTGALDAGFPGIEINGSGVYDILVHSSPVINPITGVFYIPLYGNVMLAFDINDETGSIVNLSGYVTAGGFMGLLEINENTGDMYAISGFSDLVSITPTSSTTATVNLVKSLTSGSGFSNPISTFDSENELFIFQAQSGCAENPLITIDVNTGTEWCSNPPGLAFVQMEYLNCKPANTLRENPTSFEVNVYPNPVRDILKLEIDLLKEDDIILQVFSISGSFQMERQYNGVKGHNLLDFNVANLTKGLYIIRAISGKKHFNTKIIKL